MIKIRENNSKKEEQFVEKMVDKSYDEDQRLSDRIERVTIVMEGELFDTINDIVRERKKRKQSNRTMSAFVREALEFYFLKNKKLVKNF